MDPTPDQPLRSPLRRPGLFAHLLTWVFLLGVSGPDSTLIPLLRGATPLDPPPRFESSPLANPTGTRPGFTELAARDLGIDWTNRLSPGRYAIRQNLMNGAGLTLADFDGDGRVDVFACNKEGASGLFRNLGNWRFTNVTEHAGASLTHLIATGAAAADVNGDGRPDLHVTSFLGPDALLLNLGEGRFTNLTAQAGLVTSGGNTSSAFADVDGDGDLDVYLCRFGIEAILRDGAQFATRMVNGQPVVTGRFAKRIRIIHGQLTEVGEPDILFLNDGTGRFTPAAWNRFLDEDGKPLAEAPPDFGLAVQIRDFDGNGTPDIYVCNDFQTPDRLWLGDGRGGFRAASRLALRTMSYASMGVDAADLDRDGHLDFITTEMLTRDHTRHLAQASPMEPSPRTPGDFLTRAVVPRNVLHWNRGDGTYADIAWAAGVAMSDWSWAPVFLDVDLDGFEDLLISNGHAHDLNDLDTRAQFTAAATVPNPTNAQRVILSYPPLRTPKAAWRNLGNLQFEATSEAWGFRSEEIVHGLALGDLDGDGDLDVVGNAWGQPPIFWRNEATAPRIAVRLAGKSPNRFGIGAKVRLVTESIPPVHPRHDLRKGDPQVFPRIQEQEMRAGGRYLSGDQPLLTFAAGNHSNLAVEVTWRSGRVSRLPGLHPGNLYTVYEPAEPPPATLPPASPPPTTPRFTPVPLPSSFVHRESDFDDFAAQPLLPWRLSRPGPAIATWPEGGATVLLLGGSEGGTLRAVRVLASGQASEIPAPSTDPLPGDVTSLLVIPQAPDRIEVLAAIARHDPSGHPPGILRFLRTGDAWQSLPSIPGSDANPGAMAAADLDGDQDPDLILAGRHVPGRYPLPATTRVFLNRDGLWEEEAAFSAALKELGLVTGLALADLNGDHRVDLAAACEWGPIRVFLNTGSGFSEATAALGLESHRGLWQSVAIADLNGDGRPEVIAGNWGRNSFYQRAPDGPWMLYHGDPANTDSPALLEAGWNPELRTPVPFRSRNSLAASFPWIPAAFPKHRDYARASVPSLLGTHADQFRALQINTLASSIFWNRGATFERADLPFAAQLTPVTAIATTDLDGNGSRDVVLNQNFFAVRDDDDRHDAGIGLLLENDGREHFRAVPPTESGIAVYGDMRAVLPVDIDRNGAPDLVFTQNAGAPVLFLNQGGRSAADR